MLMCAQVAREPTMAEGNIARIVLCKEVCVMLHSKATRSRTAGLSAGCLRRSLIVGVFVVMAFLAAGRACAEDTPGTAASPGARSIPRHVAADTEMEVGWLSQLGEPGAFLVVAMLGLAASVRHVRHRLRRRKMSSSSADRKDFPLADRQP